MRFVLLAVITATVVTSAIAQKSSKPTLVLPVPSKCADRPKQLVLAGHNYFFSFLTDGLEDKKMDWIDARNLCREYCMDAVSLETQQENDMILGMIEINHLRSVWTSGRLCDFKGCENRTDLEPKNIRGWLWSATRGKLPPTNEIPSRWSYNPWSSTGHKKQAQPDNAEFDINGSTESCMMILKDYYDDGTAWHDAACYHEKPVICEDSDELLEYVKATNPDIRL